MTAEFVFLRIFLASSGSLRLLRLKNFPHVELGVFTKPPPPPAYEQHAYVHICMHVKATVRRWRSAVVSGLNFRTEERWLESPPGYTYVGG
jgi:hypothetical protein